MTGLELRRRGISRVFLQVGRFGALCMALSGVGWIAATDAFAAEDPLTLELDDDPGLGPRFAVAMLIPEAEVPPPPPVLEPQPPPKPKKKKLKFGRMDAY